MADRVADLRLIEGIIRRAAGLGEPVKHHEVSLALQALERAELNRYEKKQPTPAATEKEKPAGAE